jgi:predicted secreted protein
MPAYQSPLSNVNSAETVNGILTTKSGKVIAERVITASGAVTVISADDLVTINKTTGAATVVNLPASPTTGQTFTIHDGKGDAATNNITITPAAGNINGASTLVLNAAYGSAGVTYNGTQWDAIVSTAGGGGGGGTVTGVTGTAPIVSSGGTAPAISITTPIAANYGGTGIASPTAHSLLAANGASAMNLIAPGTSGNFLVSNGTDFAGRTITSADIATALTTPGAIGGTTPAAITGTTVKANGILTTGSGHVVTERVVTAAGAVTVATTDYMVTLNKTVGAASAVSLPASPTTGTVFVIHDGKGDAATNNITITPAAGTINGAATLVLNTAYATTTLTYNGTQWDAVIGGGSSATGALPLAQFSASPTNSITSTTFTVINTSTCRLSVTTTQLNTPVLLTGYVTYNPNVGQITYVDFLIDGSTYASGGTSSGNGLSSSYYANAGAYMTVSFSTILTLSSIATHTLDLVVRVTSGTSILSVANASALSVATAVTPPAAGISTTSKSYYQRTVLYDNTLGSAGSWDVSGIDQTYDHLEIYLWGRSTVNFSGSVATVFVAFNNDVTAANYTTQVLSGAVSSATAAFNAADPQTGYVPDSGSVANSFGSSGFLIQNYTSGQYKTVLGLDGSGGLSTAGRVDVNFNLWKNTAAINRIALTVNNATTTFVTGSRLQIIGIKAETLITGVTATGAYGTNPYALAQGRLTPTSGTPILSSDVTGAAALYFTPYGGDQIGLYNGSSWTTTQFAETSLSLTGLTPNRLYDIFGYSNSGTLALEALGWTAPATGTITGVTNASPPVVSSTNTLAVDNIITIAGVVGATGVNGASFRVSAVSGSTITLSTLAGVAVGAPGVWSSGGTWYQQDQTSLGRATALVYQNGILVKSGDATRRYLGTIRIQPTSVGAGGQTEDSELRRFIYNQYNQIIHELYLNVAGSHSYTTAVTRPYNNDLSNRVQAVLGQPNTVTANYSASLSSSTATAVTFLYLGSDSISTNEGRYGQAQIVQSSASGANVNGVFGSGGSKLLGSGFHYAQQLENGNTTSTYQALNMTCAVPG